MSCLPATRHSFKRQFSLRDFIEQQHPHTIILSGFSVDQSYRNRTGGYRPKHSCIPERRSNVKRARPAECKTRKNWTSYGTRFCPFGTARADDRRAKKKPRLSGQHQRPSKPSRISREYCEDFRKRMQAFGKTVRSDKKNEGTTLAHVSRRLRTHLIPAINFSNERKGKEKSFVGSPSSNENANSKISNRNYNESTARRLGSLGRLPHSTHSSLHNRKLNQTAPEAKPVIVRKSKIHGHGLFALQNIRKDEFVIAYGGKVISVADADAIEEKYKEMGIDECYLFSLNNETILDATTSDTPARFINHSCSPNLEARVTGSSDNPELHFFSLQNIEKGNELSIRYNFEISSDGQSKVKCLCGHPNCDKFLD